MKVAEREICLELLVVEPKEIPPEKYGVGQRFMGKQAFSDELVYFSAYKKVEGLRRKGDKEQIYEANELHYS